MWGFNSQPWDSELHAPLTETASWPSLQLLYMLKKCLLAEKWKILLKISACVHFPTSSGWASLGHAAAAGQGRGSSIDWTSKAATRWAPGRRRPFHDGQALKNPVLQGEWRLWLIPEAVQFASLLWFFDSQWFSSFLCALPLGLCHPGEQSLFSRTLKKPDYVMGPAN